MILRIEAGMMDQIEEWEWTPKIVGEEMVEAAKWAFRNGGRVGPAGYGSGMPQIMMDDFDRLAEQWDLMRDMDAQPMRRQLSPAEVSRMDRVLMWQMNYLIASPVAANGLNLWLFCKVKRKARYSDLIDGSGMSRATAYRRRDNALAMIAKGLTRDGVKRGQH
jgi:hypothetical protein